MSVKEELKKEFEEAFDSPETKSLVAQGDQAISAWGDRQTVIDTAMRIKAMLPDGDKLSVPQALATGQYAVATGLNPFRGEFYPVVDNKGNFRLVDGYKALTRWAEEECKYDVTYRDEPLGPGELYNIKAIIMRHDRREQLDYYLERGADFQTAFDLVTTSAVGVVMEKETRWSDGKPKDPPKGWTWEQRAKIRALKNALNLSHGMPTIAELAKASWIVEGIETKPEDWEGTDELGTRAEQERLAELKARGRMNREDWEGLTEDEQRVKAKRNSAVLYGDHDEDDPFGMDDVVNGEVVEKEVSLDEELARALATRLHKDAPKLGLEAGQTLLEAVRHGESAKNLIEYLSRPSSYEAQTDKTMVLQEAAALVFLYWDTAVAMAGEGGETEDSQAEEIQIEEGGDSSQTPLF